MVFAMRVKLIAGVMVSLICRSKHAVHLIGHIWLLASGHWARADLLCTIIVLATDLALNLPLARLSRHWLQERSRAPSLL